MGGWFIGFGLDCPSRTDSFINICSILCSPILYAVSCIVGVAYLISSGCRKRRSSRDLTASLEEIVLVDQEPAEDHDSLSADDELRLYQDDESLLPDGSGSRKGMPPERKRAWDALNELMQNGEATGDSCFAKHDRQETEGSGDELTNDDVQELELEEVDAARVVIHEPAVFTEKPVMSHALLSDIEEEERMSDSEDEITEVIQERKQSLDHNENEEILLVQESDEVLERKIARKLALEAMSELMRRVDDVMQEQLASRSEEEDEGEDVTCPDAMLTGDEGAEMDQSQQSEEVDVHQETKHEEAEDQTNDYRCEDVRQEDETADSNEPNREFENQQLEKEAAKGMECLQLDQGPSCREEEEENEEEEDWCQIIRGPIEDRFDEMNEEEDETVQQEVQQVPEQGQEIASEIDEDDEISEEAILMDTRDTGSQKKEVIESTLMEKKTLAEAGAENDPQLPSPQCVLDDGDKDILLYEPEEQEVQQGPEQGRETASKIDEYDEISEEAILMDTRGSQEKEEEIIESDLMKETKSGEAAVESDPQLPSPPCKLDDGDENILLYEPEERISVSPDRESPADHMISSSSSPSLPPWPTDEISNSLHDIQLLRSDQSIHLNSTGDDEMIALPAAIVHEASCVDPMQSSLSHVLHYLSMKETFVVRRVSRCWKTAAEKRLTSWLILSSGEVDVSCPFGCLGRGRCQQVLRDSRSRCSDDCVEVLS